MNSADLAGQLFPSWMNTPVRWTSISTGDGSLETNEMPTPTEGQPDWSSGQKFDMGKPRMDLLDPEFLEDVASVLTFGAAKYAAHNWRAGIRVSRLIAAAYRHLGAINRGEDIDPESGLPHVAHLGCCVQFLSWTLKHKPDMDDRWKEHFDDPFN